MQLSLAQFEVLVDLERGYLPCPSTNSTNKKSDRANHLKELELAGLVQLSNGCHTLTKGAFQSLEPYRVKRALFMAAGFGKRMSPLTLTTPKPLIKVNGTPMIETLLEAVVAVGIDDITIIRGYLGEQFDSLLDKYPMVKFIENPDFSQANNISSAFYIKDLMANAYVLESDLILYNPKLIRKYEYTTNYLGMAVNHTDDWCFRVEQGIIKEVLIGGDNVHHMYGISYWNENDACKMREDIVKVYNGPGGSSKYWDEVALKDCASNYEIMVRPVQKGDIVEVDTFQELVELDPLYG